MRAYLTIIILLSISRFLSSRMYINNVNPKLFAGRTPTKLEVNIGQAFVIGIEILGLVFVWLI